MKPLSIKASTPASGPVGPEPPPVANIHKIHPKEPRTNKSVWTLRLALLLAVVGSALVIYWSYAKRLQPVTAEQQRKASEMTRIADEIEQLRFRWGPQEIAATTATYTEAKAALFQEDEIEAFREQARSEARMQVLELEEKTDERVPHTKLTNEVTVLPLTLKVSPLPILVTTNTPYSRIVSFASGATQQAQNQFELVSLSVEGNSNSVASATAIVNLLLSTSDKQ